VYEMADDTARVYLRKQYVERKKREAIAKDIVLELGGVLDDLSVGMDSEKENGGYYDSSDNIGSLLS